MVTTPTVLVLGAGASRPYFFPTADELKVLICDMFASENSKTSLLVDRCTAYTAGYCVEFRNAFLHSPLSSIDAFLERRTEYIEIGKVAIAACLMPLERPENLVRQDLRGGNWYAYLFNKLNTSFDDFGNNKLSIITFNYDRSLEHFLLRGLENTFGKSFRECVETLSQIPIVHVYGQLGAIPYPGRSSAPYVGNTDDHDPPFDWIITAAKGIKFLHEAEPALGDAHKLLTSAERIGFLGFGYHDLNLNRLKIQDSQPRKSVLGTAMGLLEGEIEQVRLNLARTFCCGRDEVALHDADNLTLLRKSLLLGW